MEASVVTENGKLPREGLVRARRPGVEYRAAEEGERPTLHGHFAIFDEWTEINSLFEGRFLERIAPGSFSKTFDENRGAMRVLFNHGHDPQVGDKVLGSIESLEQDEIGARYEVPLFDTAYNRDLIPGLEAGQYGASFRFRVTREEIDDEPERSDSNPEAIPERTVKEVQVYEFGPVTFPAYESATAGVRSLTDRYTLGIDSDPDELRELYDFLAVRLGERAPTNEDAGASAPPSPSAPPTTPLFGQTVGHLGHREEQEAWRL